MKIKIEIRAEIDGEDIVIEYYHSGSIKLRTSGLMISLHKKDLQSSSELKYYIKGLNSRITSIEDIDELYNTCESMFMNK